MTHANKFHDLRKISHVRQSTVLFLLYVLMSVLPVFCLVASTDAAQKNIFVEKNSSISDSGAIPFLSENFKQLPERQISSDNANMIYAQYTQPTSRYAHGILGDSIEAEQLVVVKDGRIYVHTLGKQYVFEDIKPRLFDVDNDGQLEIVTIRTHVTKGAGIMIYKIVNNELTEFAWVDEIGTPNRWLNIAAIYDLDSDGSVELAWIQTPHIGGVMKVARIQAGRLIALAESSGYSNHSVGERNLCLSVVTQTEKATILYVPSQDRGEIAGFQFTGGSFLKTESIQQKVNFASSLASQHDFTHVVQGEEYCLVP